MSLIFVSNFLQEVPLMTAPFHWPQRSCCPSLMATPDGKRNRPAHWCQGDIIWSSTSNMGSEPHSAFSYSGRSSSFTFPFYIQGLFFCKYWSCRTSEISLSYKMGSCGRYISEWKPSKLGLLTWISKIFFFNLKLNVSPLIDAVH